MRELAKNNVEMRENLPHNFRPMVRVLIWDKKILGSSPLLASGGEAI